MPSPWFFPCVNGCVVCLRVSVFPVFQNTIFEVLFLGTGFRLILARGTEEASVAAVEHGEALLPRLQSRGSNISAT